MVTAFFFYIFRAVELLPKDTWSGKDFGELNTQDEVFLVGIRNEDFR